MDLELAFKSGELEAGKGREELKAAGSSCGGTVGKGVCSRALFGVDVPLMIGSSSKQGRTERVSMAGSLQLRFCLATPPFRPVTLGMP